VLVPRFGLKLLKANYIHSLNFTATWSFVFLLVKNTRKGFTLYCLFFNSTWFLPDFYWIIPFASGTNLCRLQAWFVWRKNEPHIGRPHWWHERIFRSQHSRKSFLSWSDGKVCATLSRCSNLQEILHIFLFILMRRVWVAYPTIMAYPSFVKL